MCIVVCVKIHGPGILLHPVPDDFALMKRNLFIKDPAGLRRELQISWLIGRPPIHGGRMCRIKSYTQQGNDVYLGAVDLSGSSCRYLIICGNCSVDTLVAGTPILRR